MICPYCAEDGETSKVFPGYSESTLMGGGHYDEDGVYQDPNIVTSNYSCSRGHRWVEKHGGYGRFDSQERVS